MRLTTLLTTIAVAAVPACGEVGASARPVRFEIRGLATRTTETESGTSFVHTGTMFAHGDSAVARRPYMVLYTVRRLSGGDPDSPRDDNDLGVAFVLNGAGDVEISGGYRTKGIGTVVKAETWDPEKIEIRIL